VLFLVFAQHSERRQCEDCGFKFKKIKNGFSQNDETKYLGLQQQIDKIDKNRLLK